MQRKDFPKLRDLLDESIATDRPIEHKDESGWVPLSEHGELSFGLPIEFYRVQPAPPQQPKYRPMNFDELCQYASKPNSVRGKSLAYKFVIGPLTINERYVCIGDLIVDPETLVNAETGQPLQVLIHE